MTKIFSDRDFPLQNSYAGQVQCLSNSRAQKFVTSLVQSTIRHRLISFLSHLQVMVSMLQVKS